MEDEEMERLSQDIHQHNYNEDKQKWQLSLDKDLA